MTCGEAREILFAFLDNELDAPLSIDLQRHLEHCPECAREAEIEQAVRRQLEVTLTNNSPGATESIVTLDSAVEAIAGSPRRARFRRRDLGIALGIAASILVIVTGWLAFRPGPERTKHDSMADLLVADFEHFLAKGKPVEIASNDTKSVTQWLRENTELPVELPALALADSRLLGGRKCSLEGRPAAFAIYELDGVAASLVVVTGGAADLQGMERVRHEGRQHWVDRCKGHTVVACQRGNLVYAAVSTLDEDRLLALMASAAHGDQP